MILRPMLVVLALVSAATAETARVLSGEHPDFTRLVIELPQGRDWTLGRTPQGYAFSAGSGVQPDYDLANVWQRIPRTRLKALTTDPATGALGLVLGCDCHIFPFEYRPGVVVLDIKPGPAPAGSVFEAAAAPAGAAATAQNRDQGTQRYDWLSDLTSGRAGPVPSLPLPLDTGSVSLLPLRDALLEGLALGAADGIVDLRLPVARRKPSAGKSAELPWSNVRLGELPGIAVTDPGAPGDALLPMSDCADASLLDLPSWGGTLPPQELLATTRAGLYGEFDTPEPDAILASVRGLLYLGFGAEAGQQVGLIGQETEDPALPLYRSMALIVDGESDPQTPFARMLDCDGPAALWAALAHDRLPAGPGVNRDAILQAFAALPSHLRRQLGAGLAEKFLARDDPEAARIIRDAMERAPGADKAAVALLDAKADLRDGDAKTARVHAEAAVALGGNQVDALVALVETHVRTLDPIGPETVQNLLALQGEVEGTEDGPAFDRALVLALALSGQIKPAFDQDAATGAVLADLWRIAKDRAPDDAFLAQAVLPVGEVPVDVPAEIRLGIAERLLALGFPDAAQLWIGPVDPAQAPDRRLVAAKAAVGRGDARSAVALLDGLESPEAAAVRAQALLQLGDLAAAGQALTVAGQADEAARLGLWQGKWAQPGPALPDLWRQAADPLGPATAIEGSGLLQRSGQAIEASLASRTAIEDLLAGVPSPTAE